ncbi:MAG: NADPH-dependent glutamate synthase [Oscillospiraceae bacterium]|nr:NADPH-dependent glutamate synthase [Oscillospiraceae bacterium]
MAKTKTYMPLLPIDKRRATFEEVALGYTAEQARKEAGRCLNCKHRPCVSGCPVNVAIPEFIAAIHEGDGERAGEIIRKTNSLPAVCGRVCPQENQCEKLCVRGRQGEPVAIGRLERYAAEFEPRNGGGRQNAEPINVNHPAKTAVLSGTPVKVAVIGSGPAGLSAAGTLAKAGFTVSIFEALHNPGGVLAYGIPEFRLPKNLVKKEIDALTSLGVSIETNVVIGKSLTLDDLRGEGFSRFVICSGAGLPQFMNIKGETLPGVLSANEFLTRVNLMKAYRFPEFDTPVRVGRKAVVVGGGNVAMDAARCALRLGAEVTLVYRRGREEMPARAEEIEHAIEEGVRFELLTNPVEYTRKEDGTVGGVSCVRMELGEPDASGRRRPREIAGSEFTIDCDTAIIAIGNAPNPTVTSALPDLATQKWGGVIADDDGRTNLPNVYAAGDAVSGAATVILAMGAGMRCAMDIINM